MIVTEEDLEIEALEVDIVTVMMIDEEEEMTGLKGASTVMRLAILLGIALNVYYYLTVARQPREFNRGGPRPERGDRDRRDFRRDDRDRDTKYRRKESNSNSRSRSHDKKRKYRKRSSSNSSHS